MTTGEARSAGGMRLSARRTRRRPAISESAPTHYLTQRESRALFARQRKKDEARGIFRRWNDRQLTEAQKSLAEKQRLAAAKKKPRRKRIPKPQPTNQNHAPR